MLFELLLIGYLVYRNSTLARTKGRNIFLWGIGTFVAIFLAYTFGTMTLLLWFYRDAIPMLNDINKSQQAAQHIAMQMRENVLQYFYIMFCGFGGYLLIRYLLERIKTSETK
jgi:hypothetical protein